MSNILDQVTVPEDEMLLFTSDKVVDSANNQWRVMATMFKSDYSCDVELQVASVIPEVMMHIGGVQLCRDDVFLDSIHKELQALGYEGSRLGRAEMGMQERDKVVLETGSGFEQFAHDTLGWRYAGGEFEWEISSLQRAMNRSFPHGASLRLKGHGGSIWEVPMTYVLMAFYRGLEDEHGEESPRVLEIMRDPALRGNVEALASWIAANAGYAWGAMKDFAREVRSPSDQIFVDSLRERKFTLQVDKADKSEE